MESFEASEKVMEVLQVFILTKQTPEEIIKRGKWARLEIYKIIFELLKGAGIENAEAETFARISAKSLFDAIKIALNSSNPSDEFDKIMNSAMIQIDKQIQRLQGTKKSKRQLRFI